jgi:hypothetical protein
VQAKERMNVERKSIIPHNLGDGVQPITGWVKLSMGSYKAFFLQVQPNFIAHLKIMWNPMLIMPYTHLGDVEEIFNPLGVSLGASES